MKLCDSLKFILLVVYISRCHDTLPNDLVIVARDTNMSAREISSDLKYIVWVTTAGGVNQMKEYSEKACTGTLIRNDLVMTLASCLLLDYDEDPHPDFIRVHERPKGHILHALKIFINPKFYSSDQYVSNSHDFGLVLVDKSAQSVFPRMPTSLLNFRDIKHTCVLGGYGADTHSNLLNNFRLYVLNRIEVEVFRGHYCVSEDKLCLRFLKIIPCLADFGSPLICGGTLYALYTPRAHLSKMSTKCFDLFITTFSPLNNVKDWVVQIMDAPTSNLEWLNNPFYVLLLCAAVFFFMGGIYYGLVEILQRHFDPSEGMQQTPFQLEDDQDDEDSWYESQWNSR